MNPVPLLAFLSLCFLHAGGRGVCPLYRNVFSLLLNGNNPRAVMEIAGRFGPDQEAVAALGQLQARLDDLAVPHKRKIKVILDKVYQDVHCQAGQ